MRYVDDIPAAKRYSVIGLGTWQFGSKEWGYGGGYDDAEAGRIVRRARELGITVFDTAEVYGFGRSERILGEALRNSGGTDDVVVATKVFPVVPTAAVVQQRGVASAQRLGVRTIDLYQVHWPNPVVRDATAMRGMRALRDVGVVDQVGVSNYPLRRWQRAEVDLGGVVLSNQVQFSLVSRGPMAEMLPWAARTGHVVIAYSPLAQGLLSARYDADAPPDEPRPGRERDVPAGEPARRRPAAVGAARGGGGARRDAGADRPGVDGAPPARRRDPRGVEHGAGGEQRRRGGDHAGARRVRRAARGGGGVQPDDRGLGDPGVGARPPLLTPSRARVAGARDERTRRWLR